jgi:hypothetical protein
MLLEARRILALPKTYSPLAVAEYLIETYHSVYPGLRKYLYASVTASVMNTQMITGPTGWTRYCFKNPAKDKRALNAYVAHVGQSANAMKLNIAYMRVFYQIALNPEHSQNFKLCAQIHDSILFQFRKGHEYLCQKVADLMQVPIRARGYDGNIRDYTVPAAIKAGSNGTGAYRWADTE